MDGHSSSSYRPQMKVTTRNNAKYPEMICGDGRGVDGMNTPQQRYSF
jgi:hypothetical protein